MEPVLETARPAGLAASSGHSATRAALACLGVLVLIVLTPAGAAAQDAGQAEEPAAATNGGDDPVIPEPIAGELSLSQSFAIEASPQAEAGAEPVATVGTPLVLTLEVKRPANTTVTLPEEQATGRFELLRVERTPPPAQPGAQSVTETIRMVYAVYRPGRHRLEPFSLSVLDAEGRVSTLTTEALELRVMSLTADDAEPTMPALRAPVPIWIEDWTLVWLLSIFGGLLVAGGLGAWLHRRLTPKEAPPPPPPRPAWEVAIEKLGAIKSADLVGAGLYEEFYVRISEAVREYMGRRYNLSLTDKAGLELTTWELVALLGDIRWPRGLSRQEVEALLYDCDMVKFARYAPSDEEAEEILTRAYRLVELTRPVELGVPGASASDPGEAQEGTER